VAALLSCSDPAPPALTLETLALSLDSIAIQLRDSASELTASPRGALGVELEAEVSWRSKNTDIVGIVPNGKTVRLVPVRPGATEVEAIAEDLVATARVVVLDTVFSVAISAPDTIVTMGRSLQFTATVTGPPGASQQVVWSVGDSAVARIDSSQGKNPVQVVSLDTGSTDVIATSAADRLRSARVRFHTARPVSLVFPTEPGQVLSPIRANDVLIPGPVVSVRDALGNTFPGEMDITMTIESGTGRLGAALFGTAAVRYASGEARFGNLGVDSAGSGFRLRATAPGVDPAISAPFTVGPECPGIPYSIGTVVSGTITADSCRSSADVYYVRYIVSAPGAQVITGMAPPMRWGVVFRDGTRPGPQSDTTPHLVAAGNYSVRVYTGVNQALGDYQLSTKPAFLTKQWETPFGWICWRTQTHVPVEFSDETRCGIGSGVVHACGGSFSHGSLYRLHLHPNKAVTITASSSEIDPCLAVISSDGQLIALDDNSGGGTTARVVVPPSPNGRNVLVNVTGPMPIPASSRYTIKIQ
jgi:hypothetical protein